MVRGAGTITVFDYNTLEMKKKTTDRCFANDRSDGMYP